MVEAYLSNVMNICTLDREGATMVSFNRMNSRREKNSLNFNTFFVIIISRDTETMHAVRYLGCLQGNQLSLAGPWSCAPLMSVSKDASLSNHPSLDTRDDTKLPLQVLLQ